MCEAPRPPPIETVRGKKLVRGQGPAPAAQSNQWAALLGSDDDEDE